MGLSMKRSLIVTTSLFALLSTPAFAGEAPTPNITSAIPDEVVVSANRIAQMRTTVGTSITVLTREMIESRQAVAVTDLLAQTPGVSFSRNGDMGGVTGVRIRGAESDHTIMVVDGVKLNDPSGPGGGYNFADLLIGDAARIEILRGAHSTLWGSQAIGGVVNVITAEATNPFEVNARAEGGSRNTAYGVLTAGGKSEHVSWRISGSHYLTDGLSSYALGPEKDGYQNSGLTGRLRFDVTEALSLDLRGQYLRSHNQVDGFPPPVYAFADTAEFGKSRQFVGYAGVNFALRESQFKNRLAFGYTDIDRDSFNPDKAVTPVTFESLGRNKRAEYQGSFAFTDSVNATFGAEQEKTSFRTASPSSFTPNPPPAIASATLTSGYAQVQGEVVSGLTLSGGLRYDSHNTFGGKAVGQAAAAWALNGGDTVLRASFGQGFKAPTLYQLYSIYGNTGLSPETADSFDGGIEQHVLDDVVVVSATGFARTIRNQIDFVVCPSTNPLCTAGKFGVYDNIARTKAHGVELTAEIKADAMSISANYTLTDTENASVGNVNLGRDLARRPKHGATLTASYAWPFEVSTAVMLRYVGKSFDNAANTVVLSNYALVDLRAAYHVTDTVEVYGRIENLFDQAYATVRNYGTARRGAFAGVRAKF